jgi:hypothetical protein
MTSAGTIPDDSLPPQPHAAGISAGPDGALWYTARGSNAIGRVTTGGVVTTFVLPTATAGPSAIVTGPDGAPWFTEYDANKIGRITTAGSITEFPVPQGPMNNPASIAAGPDGALWFTGGGQDTTYYGAPALGRITTAGQLSTFPLPNPYGLAADITTAGDGSLWFTDLFGNTVNHLVFPPAGAPPVVTRPVVPPPLARPVVSPAPRTKPVVDEKKTPPVASATLPARISLAALRRGTTITIACKKACSISATVTLTARLAKTLHVPRTIASGKVRVRTPGHHMLRLKSRISAKQALKARGKTATLRVATSGWTRQRLSKLDR